MYHFNKTNLLEASSNKSAGLTIAMYTSYVSHVYNQLHTAYPKFECVAHSGLLWYQINWKSSLLLGWYIIDVTGMACCCLLLRLCRVWTTAAMFKQESGYIILYKAFFLSKSYSFLYCTYPQYSWWSMVFNHSTHFRVTATVSSWFMIHTVPIKYDGKEQMGRDQSH